MNVPAVLLSIALSDHARVVQNLLDSRSLKFIVGLHDRTTKSLLHLHKKKRPPSISAQFQVLLFQPNMHVLEDILNIAS